MTLMYGAGHTPRRVETAEALLREFVAMDEGRGALYYDLPVVRADRVTSGIDPVSPDAERPTTRLAPEGR